MPSALAPVEFDMTTYSLSHLSDHLLLRDLTTLVSQDRATTARLLAHLAEVDARGLYLPAGYPSMYAWCVGELHLCEQAALKRIRAARTARQFPAIFAAVADGRLHLSTVVLLTRYLTTETAKELLRAAAHKSTSEVEKLLAERFPRSEMLPMVQALSASGAPGAEQRAPGRVEQLSPGTVEPTKEQLASGRTGPRSKMAPIAPQRFALQLTMSQELHAKLRYAQELLSHQIPSGDITKVLERALDALILELEKRKYGATLKPRSRPRRSNNPRTIPAHVRRAVRQRDGRQCTFVSESGHRCQASTQLEFDHIDEVARGGVATVEGIRLRCRAHNQYAAECTFGAEFMARKRQEAQAVAARATAAARAAETAREAEAARVTAAAAARRVAIEKSQEVTPWLRRLGIRADEARQAAVLCQTIPDAPLEQRVRVALSCFGPRTSSRGRVAAASAGCGP